LWIKPKPPAQFIGPPRKRFAVTATRVQKEVRARDAKHLLELRGDGLRLTYKSVREEVRRTDVLFERLRSDPRMGTTWEALADLESGEVETFILGALSAHIFAERTTEIYNRYREAPEQVTNVRRAIRALLREIARLPWGVLETSDAALVLADPTGSPLRTKDVLAWLKRVETDLRRIHAEELEQHDELKSEWGREAGSAGAAHSTFMREMAPVVINVLGKPRDQIVADLANVVFDTPADSPLTPEAARSARRKGKRSTQL
jgi:hypothetical protein